MRIIILGCGSSGGVPLITGEWGRCDPNNPRNRRRRSSVLLQIRGKNILIDAGPDLREQLLDEKITNIDAVLFTHAHSDHLRGIDDLRQIALRNKQPIPVYGDPKTLATIEHDYSYAIHQRDELYPSFLMPHSFSPGTLLIDNIEILAFPQNHGKISSWGFRIGDFAYSTDFHEIPEASLQQLKGLKCWITGCLRFDPHPTHSNFENTMALIQKLQPKEAILTHMNQDLDYNQVIERLQKNVRPAIDGMIIEVSDEEIIIYDKFVKKQ